MFRHTKIMSIACVLGALGATTVSHAQFAVIDVGAIAQLITQVRTLQDQLTQARAEFESMTGGRGMERLLEGILRNYLPPDWLALEAALRGAGDPALARKLAAAMEAIAVLTPEQIALLSDQEREQLEAGRKSAALLQVTSREALEASSARFEVLQQLIDAIPEAADQKAVLDLQARIAAEQAMLQNENTKLMLLYHATHAEELAREQRAQELAIANIGSLRDMPPIGLNP